MIKNDAQQAESPTPTAWQRVEALFHAAHALAPDQRAQFLDLSCGDPAARREVESLLAAAAAETGSVVVDGNAVSVVSRPDSAPIALPEVPAGAVLGPYRVERLIGRGGMGEVYLARRADGAFEQEVAVKVLRAEAGAHLARFHAERQILAGLEHPGIARLLDGGVAPDGRPYMAMEYVAGATLAEHCRANPMGLAARLDLFLQICDAVAYAHANLVVHRDLKSANVVVTPAARTKLLDFGIAKLVDPAFGRATVTQVAPLTPETAAPEQLQGRPITTATDVYSLGVILHELLSGEPLWDFRNTPISKALHTLLHDEPRSPSEVAARNPEPPIPTRILQGDLDAIVGKCLMKEPAERYPTVNSLKNDITRYLEGAPVSAGPGSRLYHARKFVRRHRALVLSAAAVVASLAAGLVVSASFYLQSESSRRAAVAAQEQAEAERNRALAAVATTEAVNRFLTNDLLQSGGDEATAPAKKDATLRSLLDRAAAHVDQRFEGQPAAAAGVHEALGRTYVAIGEWRDGVGHLRKAIALYETLQGRLSDAALGATSVLAEVLGWLDQHAESMALQTEVLSALDAQLGGQHARTLEARSKYVWTSLHAGQFQRATAEQRRLVTLLETPGHPLKDQLEAHSNLAYFLIQSSEFKEAAQVARALLPRLDGTGNTLDPVQVGVAHLVLGAALTEQGTLEEADGACARGMALILSQLDPDHAYALIGETFTGRLRVEQGRFDEARQLLQHALAVREKRAGADSSLVSWTRHLLAEVHQRQGHLQEARAALEAALPVNERIDGAGHPYTLKIRATLADVLREQREPERARAVLGAAPAGAVAALPDRHVFLAHWRRVEGLLERAAGNTAAANAALAEALAIYEVRLGATHWRTQRVGRELSTVSASDATR